MDWMKKRQESPIKEDLEESIRISNEESPLKSFEQDKPYGNGEVKGRFQREDQSHLKSILGLDYYSLHFAKPMPSWMKQLPPDSDSSDSLSLA